MANLSLVITLMIMVVVVSFNSFRLSMIIFAVSALAAGLGLLSVWVFQYPFGFTVIIALLGLIGLAINAAIVILSEFKADPQKYDSSGIRHNELYSPHHLYHNNDCRRLSSSDTGRRWIWATVCRCDCWRDAAHHPLIILFCPSYVLYLSEASKTYD